MSASSRSATTSSRLGPQTAIRVAPDAYRSVHNDTDENAELVICSVRADGANAEPEMTSDFWPAKA